jgi:addiction module RelE/StbE family toxin
MNVDFAPSFHKSFRKRIESYPKLIKKFDDRVQSFKLNPSNPLLNDHPLHGDKEGLRSFSISGDLRVIYYLQDDDTAIFLDIGSHNQVY